MAVEPHRMQTPVRHILHIADVHIRSGPAGLARRSEYREVVDNLLAVAHALDGPVVTVVAGDVLHDRSALDPHSLRVFNDLFRGLSAVGPVVVVQGNHDHHPMHDDPDAPHDVLGALVDVADIPGVMYLRATGYYTVADGLGVGVVTVHDSVAPGEARSAQDAPDVPFPAPPDDGRFHIAMYHGAIEGSRSDASVAGGGQGRRGAPIAWFQGYDAVMLGDQHLQQVGNHVIGQGDTMSMASDSRRPTWAYPGSLLQQGHGESLWNHGAIVWDVAERTLRPLHVRNPSGYVTLRGGDLFYDGAWQPVEAHVRDPDFPRRVHARLKDCAGDALAMLCTAGVDVVMNSASRKVDAPLGLDSSDIDTAEGHINWKASMSERGIDCDVVLEAALLPAVTETSLRAVVDARNARLEKLARSVRDAGAVARRPMRPTRLAWSWLLCFGPGNEVGILGDDGVVLVSGRNAVGKTAFLEVILLALFGEGFPSRASRESSAILNVDAPSDASAELDFELDGALYRVSRTWSRSAKDSARATCKVAEVARLDGAKCTPLCKGKVAVNEWITDNVCTVDDFLAGPMLSQGNDGDVLGLSPKDMAGLMERAFGLAGIDALGDLIVDATNAHRQLTARADAMLNGVDREAYDAAKRAYRDAAAIATALKRELSNAPNPVRPTPDALAVALADVHKYGDAGEHDPAEHARVQSDIRVLRACVLPDPGDVPVVADQEAAVGQLVPPATAAQLWARYRAVCDRYPFEHRELRADAALVALAARPVVDAGSQALSLQRCERVLTAVKGSVDSLRRGAKTAEADLTAATDAHAAGAVVLLAAVYDKLGGSWEAADSAARAVKLMEYLTSPLASHLPRAGRLAELCPPGPELLEAPSFDVALLRMGCARPETAPPGDRPPLSVADAGRALARARDDLRDGISTLDDAYASVTEAREAVLSSPSDQDVRRMRALRDMSAAAAGLAGIDFEETARALEAQLADLEVALRRHKQAKKLATALATVLAEQQATARAEVQQRLDAVSIDEATLEWGRCRGAKAVLDDELALNESRRRLDVLVDAGTNLRGAKSWLYRACVAPQVQTRVNAVVARVEPGLRASCVVTDDGGLLWRVQDGDKLVGMTRASGFQRFMIGVAIRIVLGGMLAPCSLQVIDEGFTCLDSAHLARVPEFLDWLVQRGGVRTVLLVSHLTELRNSVARIVDLEPGRPFVA